MSSGQRFNRLDAFTKTVEDARIRTTSGGIITLASLVMILYLVWGEFADFRRITVHPSLIVDKGRNEKMEIFLNISFPRVPCEILTLDVMDVAGNMQSDVVSGISRTRLSPVGEGSKVIETNPMDIHEHHNDMGSGYCGDCYGAVPPANALKKGCCNTCEDVREAYHAQGWGFSDGKGIEQCDREHYSEHLHERRREGCRIAGGFRVNKVVGNFHFAPGKSMNNGGVHVHDLRYFLENNEPNSFSHEIHELRFGPSLPDKSLARYVGSTGISRVNAALNPLDGTGQITDEKAHNFMYFIKVVPTVYIPLDFEHDVVDDIPHELIDLGEYGYTAGGSIETHQYSVTSHQRSLAGGSAADEGHKERMHTHSGIPGVFFSFDISPMKVVNKEQRVKSFSSFLVGVCAVVGGTLTVAAAIDRGFYEGSQRLKVKDR